MQSLKEKLKTAIRLRGFLTNGELWQICYKEGAKPDQATRRLREILQPTHSSYDPHIYAKRENGIIRGYGWKEAEWGTGQKQGKDWCDKCGFFLNHSPNCQLKVQEKITLF